jgi:hypothetical protein
MSGYWVRENEKYRLVYLEWVTCVVNYDYDRKT